MIYMSSAVSKILRQIMVQLVYPTIRNSMIDFHPSRSLQAIEYCFKQFPEKPAFNSSRFNKNCFCSNVPQCTGKATEGLSFDLSRMRMDHTSHQSETPSLYQGAITCASNSWLIIRTAVFYGILLCTIKKRP